MRTVIILSKRFLYIAVLIILILFFSARPSFAQGWLYQNPYPTKNTLLAVKFVTPQKGWVAGEHGTILYTEDGGENWEAQESGTEEDLKSISFVNEKSGWAVGNGGVVIHTEDGGKNWVKQSDSRAKLHIVFFLNENEGWVGGSMGTFLHTRDGGKSWNKQDIGATGVIAGIFLRIQLQAGSYQVIKFTGQKIAEKTGKQVKYLQSSFQQVDMLAPQITIGGGA